MVWMPKYTITKEILSYLTKIESIKNSFEDKPLSPVLLSSLHQSAKISQTHYSTQIEGNNLTLKQVKIHYIQSINPPKPIKVMMRKKSKPIMTQSTIWKSI